MPDKEGEKHPLIELAERHLRKIKAYKGEGLLTPEDLEMRHQLFVIISRDGGDPRLAQPTSWVDGRELTDDVHVSFPDGSDGIVDRSKAYCLVKRLLTESDQALVARYLGVPT